MTNQALIQSKVWRGYAQAARRLGTMFDIRRPDDTGFPGSVLFSRFVSLNAEDMKYGKPNKYGKPTWYALVDGNGLLAGDYLVGPQGTFFIAALQPLLPILVVECNRTVTLSRVQTDNTVGAQGYSGMTSENETPFASGVPCSILQGTKGEKNDAGLPADTRLPWWTILMPASAGPVVYGDLIADDLGRRYVVSSPELTDLGYRITASMATV
ncbi:hypothetical protein [Zavarzinella formosa]|uniref:hypothetical protein n=1 Tax=Zavarzinella formosa TaxID=360055 RepID=UPI0002F3B01E|nr:hypothetical protein [Zavarzinella formosa]